MKASIFVCLSTLIAAAGFAQAPGPAPAPASPPATSPAVPDGAVLAAKQPLPTKSSCTASCGGSATVSCSGAGSCSAVDRNCGANERGHVTCNGVTTYCSASCACGSVCNCSAPCFSSPCDSGGGYIIDCADWGICTTSCYCGGECLRTDDPSSGSSSSRSTGACAPTSAPSDPLLAKIFS
jgi:hypothetical protein